MSKFFQIDQFLVTPDNLSDIQTESFVRQSEGMNNFISRFLTEHRPNKNIQHCSVVVKQADDFLLAINIGYGDRSSEFAAPCIPMIVSTSIFRSRYCNVWSENELMELIGVVLRETAKQLTTLMWRNQFLRHDKPMSVDIIDRTNRVRAIQDIMYCLLGEAEFILMRDRLYSSIGMNGYGGIGVALLTDEENLRCRSDAELIPYRLAMFRKESGDEYVARRDAGNAVIDGHVHIKQHTGFAYSSDFWECYDNLPSYRTTHRNGLVVSAGDASFHENPTGGFSGRYFFMRGRYFFMQRVAPTMFMFYPKD